MAAIRFSTSKFRRRDSVRSSLADEAVRSNLSAKFAANAAHGADRGSHELSADEAT